MSSSTVGREEPKGEGDDAAPAAKQHEIDAIFEQKKKIQKRKDGRPFPASQPTISRGKPGGSLEDDGDRVVVQAKTESNKKAKKRKQNKDIRATREAFIEGEEASFKPLKLTEEGYRVYRGEDLGWNKKDAGGTPLCPFDCNCCF